MPLGTCLKNNLHDIFLLNGLFSDSRGNGFGKKSSAIKLHYIEGSISGAYATKNTTKGSM